MVMFLPEETQGRPLQDMAGEGGDAGRGKHQVRPHTQMERLI